MANRATLPTLRLIQRLVEDPRVQRMTDRDLLGRFRADGDEAAFQALVRRHGAMVLEVCRGVLGNEADAEDAFQATFLVLAQKAAAIWNEAAVGSWLYGVAYRTAVTAQRNSARRQRYENRPPAQSPTGTVDDLAWREVKQALYEELNGMSKCYRAPLVLCYLEGRTQDEAAALLGVSKATVKKRLEHGRALLRARLIRRGLGSGAMLVAAAWPLATASAGPGSLLVSATAKAAALIAAGSPVAGGLVSTNVAPLTKGVLKAMFLTKLKATTVVLLAVALAGTGSGVFTYRTLAAGQAGGGAAAPASQAPDAKDAAAVSKLVEQLGSDSFADREKATRELDRIGAAALDALRKAAKGDDPERRRRAEGLVRKIEQRDLAAALLAPKRVHLVYKDTPLAEAVADFKKKSGYELSLSDPEGKLKDRKVTLDTGEVTFWQALDQFCQKAHLLAALPSPPNGATRLSKRSQLTFAQPPLASADSTGGNPGQGAIILTDGETQALPSDDHSSVRVRALPRAERSGPLAEGASMLALEVTPEPRLCLLQIIDVHVRKATDDEGQSREPVIAFGGQAPPASRRSFLSEPPVREIDLRLTQVNFQKGAKASATLTEITGTITIRVQVEGSPPDRSSILDVPFALKNVHLQ